MNREIWHDNYINELIDMYIILKNILIRNYPKLEINDEYMFHHFSRLIYHISSKELSEYTISGLK